jgi:hypothetical protein
MIALPLPPAIPRPRVFVVSALLYAGLIFALSSVPGSALPHHGRFTDWSYNVLHAPLFGGLALLAGSALVVPLRESRTTLTPRGAIACLSICFLYALFDEFHQSYVRGRAPDSIDLVTDLAGIGAAIVLLRRHEEATPWATVRRFLAFAAVAATSAWLATRPFSIGAAA